jgi:hypothetical protein
MNESSAIAVFMDPFEIDGKLAGVMLGVRKDFGAEEGNDMVTDNVARLIAEIGVVDAEIGIEPVYFIGDKFLRDEAFCSDLLLNEGSLFFFTFENWGCIAWKVLDSMQQTVAAASVRGSWNGKMRV